MNYAPNHHKLRRARVTEEEYQLLQQLRERSPAQNPPKMPLTLGDRIADKVVASMGSWRFILFQSTVLLLWIVLNVLAFIQHWDPYPFILLNLALSFQAAYAAPFIMMSQNRQAATDRQEVRHDYEVNMKAELEIELLHDKMNLLREFEILELRELLNQQSLQLQELAQLLESVLVPSETSTPRTLDI